MIRDSVCRGLYIYGLMHHSINLADALQARLSPEKAHSKKRLEKNPVEAKSGKRVPRRSEISSKACPAWRDEAGTQRHIPLRTYSQLHGPQAAVDGRPAPAVPQQGTLMKPINFLK